MVASLYMEMRNGRLVDHSMVARLCIRGAAGRRKLKMPPQCGIIRGSQDRCFPEECGMRRMCVQGLL
jgi:hypothetical protein